MSIKITFEVENVAAAIDLLATINGESGTVTVGPAASTLAANLAAIPEAPKRGRKPKAVEQIEPSPAAVPVVVAAAPVPQQPVQAPQPAPAPVVQATAAPAPAVSLTDEQRMGLLTQIYGLADRGPEKAMAILQRFGVGRLRDVKPESLADFDAKAQAVVAGTYDPVAG